MSFNTFRKNKILGKISKFTVLKRDEKKYKYKKKGEVAVKSFPILTDGL